MTGSEKYKLFSTLASVPRTGWVQRGVSAPESVAEHIYGCWLLGTFLLPEAHTEPTYSKQEILDMLLLHDLPEAVTGDIPRPEKKKNPLYYEQLEQQAAQSSLLSGACTDYQRRLWQAWSNGDTFNALVAKDIDDLQAIFTFKMYKEKNPALFSEEDSAAWLSGLEKMKTDLGRQMAKELFGREESGK